MTRLRPPFPVFFSIDRRRPASWIALGMGVAAGIVGAGGSDRFSAGILTWALGAVAAVAAIGDLPLPLLPSPGRGRSHDGALSWAGERIAWPLTGMLLATALWMRRDGGTAIAWSATATVLTGATIVAARAAAASVADAAAVAVVLAVIAAAPAVALVPAFSPAAVAVATTAWLLIGGLAWVRVRAAAIEAGGAASMDEIMPERPGETGDRPPSNGRVRGLLVGLAMATSLAMMAGWLVLVPEIGSGDPAPGVIRAGVATVWGILSLASFTALAAPQATLHQGIAGGAAWDRLVRSAVRAAGSRRATLPWALSGAADLLASGRMIAWSHAVVLGWPPVVGGFVRLPASARSTPAFGIVLALAAAAAVVVVVGAVGARLALARETALAIVLVGLTTLLGVWLECGAWGFLW